jgi:hypothetical protein
MLYHCTYRDRAGATQVARTDASSRNQAITNIVCRYGCKRASVSAVSVGKGARHYGGAFG